jgi:hypothetical protein
MAQSSLGNISLKLSRTSTDSLTGGNWSFEWSGAYGLSLTMADEDTRFGWGIEFGDLDNDTDLDLAVLFGWYDDDADGGWRDLTYPDHLYVQDLEMFKDQGVLRGFDGMGHGRGLVLDDINGDGCLDAVKRQLNDAPSMVLTALCGDASWIGVTLEQPTTMNRDAIGAVVDAWIDGTRHRRWMTSGSTSLFAGQDPKAHFGLGDKGTVDHIDITWPDGQTHTVHDLEPNRWHHLIRL